MKGKHSKKLHWNKNRVVCALLCAVLLVTAISFSSMAWLTYKKQEVQQVFKGTTLNITLGGEKGEYPLVPGAKYPLTGDKIPKVTIAANSVDCYVFVLREYFWYDATYYDNTSDHIWYPIDVMNRDFHSKLRENDNFKPDRSGNPDDDYGFTDYYGWNPSDADINISAYKTGRTGNTFNGSGSLPLDIEDSTGVIGERCLFGYLGLSDPNATPGEGSYTKTSELKYKVNADDNSFSDVFKTSAKDRHIYILEGNADDCYLEVMGGIGKIQTLSSDRLPKIRFTAFTVQAEGLTRDQAADLVIDAIKKDSELGVGLN